uniref:Nebulin n=1 Tax=Jaculus jaculus TaxID=51337 RepID=A0A8C5KGT3_JACJA
ECHDTALVFYSQYYTEETVYEEIPGQTITEVYETTTTRTVSDYDQSETSKPALVQPEPAKPVERKKVIRKKVDTSKFMTPYIEHSQKMQDLFSTNKYKENFEKTKGQPYASTSDTPELRRIKKVQDQLSEVKYRMDGDVAKTICHVDEKSRDIEHSKKVSQQVSKVLYKQNWEDTKDKYLLPPDAPELVQAIKNTAMFSKKLYTEDWEADKGLFYPYNDSPELRRVAQAQKALSDISYKKGLIEQNTHFTPLPDPPDIEFAKKVNNQVSKQKYKEDYEKNVKGKWSETPCFEIATARMNADNLSTRKYQEDFENIKDQIYFMQTETPEYKVNKQAKITCGVKYKEDYEKNKAKADYNVLPASENPLLRQLKAAGNILSDKLYKENYENTKAKSINYCETPKFQLDTVLQNFSSDTKYRDSYLKNILGHYVGSFEDPYHTHCMKVSAQNSDKNYKAEYEEDRGKVFFPQTITQEYEAIKKLDQCKDHTYKVHPDKTKFTQVTDSPVQVQAQVNTKQLSDLNYKAKHESEKFKCHVPPDTPALIQHKVNAYNLSDNVYKHDWEKTKAKKFDIKVDAIPLLAAKANSRNASDVMYKKDYEKSKGKMIGALSINDDPKMLHSLKTAKNQSDRLYRENYEKTKAKSMNYCETPKYQLDTLLKNFSEAKYKDSYVKNMLGHYVGSFEDPYHTHCMKVSAQNSDKMYKAEYEEDKGKCYFPQTITQEYEAIKKLDQCKDHTYKMHPDKTRFTAVTDTPVLLQAQLNTKQLSDLNYKAKHEGEKFKCNVPADAPEFIQHRVNAYNLSDNVYKHDWEKTKAKKFDIKVDAIPLLAAKANSRNASDVMYKKDYEKSKGKMIGALSINDDPKMLHSLKTAKNQSDREYRKDYEKSKTIYTAPLDMLQVTQAKKSQAIVSDVDYKHTLHSYSYPPDSINVDLAKKAQALQSDVEYKADYNSWMKGCGWVPFGSLEMEKAKRASDILNEKKYRQHPDTLKFTSIEDAPITVQSKINQAQRSDIAYKAKGEEMLHKYSLPADLPQFIQAKVNAYNISENMYKADLKDLSKKGYDLRIDAIPIKAAKAARQVASDIHYKKDYEKAKGKMVGFQSLQDDPKLVHYMNVAKIQSDREYKKDYEKTKTKYNTPHDMFDVVAAKKAQDVISNTNYKHSLHHYTYLPDAMDLELSKNMMHIQSDNAYKEDYNTWMKGIGWIPIGSLDQEKVKKAGDALSEKKYRQHPDTLKFTSITDTPVMVQAKQNTQQVSDILYKAKGEDVKHKYTISPDLPQFLQAKCNAYNISDVCYKRDWHKLIAKGNNVLADAIPITAAKSSRNIASDYKYKETYEKSKGKHVGFRSLQDDPKLVHYMNVAKLQSDREYKKNYENTKTSYHTPGDMVSITAAKMAQDVATNVNYKQPLHHYTYLPDAMSVEHTRHANQIQSDNVYKDEYNNFFKGIGWIPIGSLEVEKAKKAGDALNERKYRQHPDTIKFTSVPDSMGMVLAQQNTKQLSDLKYKVEGEKLKHKYTIDPELPQFIQAKVNAINMSDAHYKADWKKTLAKGYDLRPDAIPIVAAKSSRNIAKTLCTFKNLYPGKAKGKQIGFLSLQDDPKLVHYMNVAKIQSDREYKKGYEASKTRYHTPLDMFSVTAAKKSQEVATNANYRQPYHNYTLLPDALNVEHSKNAMQIQSDNVYKSDFTNWMRGIGWVPIDSLEVEKAKKAGDILSERKYRQHPEKLKFTYSMDTMEQALNKSNKLTMDKRLYTEKWNKDKTTIHVMPDTPDILLSRVNQVTMSDKLYKAGWEEEKKKGYDLRPDAISIKAAKASRDIASDYKYKQAYEQAKGKHIGFRSLEDDPKLVHFMQVAKMQSDREYKKGYEKSKTSFHTPVDMVSVVAAKKSQEVATNANYRNIIHTYNMLPDAMSFELAKNMMQIQSDNQYKADYADFMKGIGWLPLGSLEAEKNKKAMEIISEKKYRQHPDTLKYSSLMDSMNMVLAQNNAKIMNEHLYKQAWEADKTKIHMMPDIPQIVLAKANAINMSDKLYKLSLEESKKKGYDLRTDAIPIKAAKASRDIASDYKYKYNYEKEKGKMVGFRSLEDDPKLVHSMQVAKMQSDREYKKNYENTKTSYHTPADMLSVTAAKDAQANITNTNYKHLIHKYILLPDAMNIELTRNMNHIQSDNEYKQDYNEWYKGLGWSPAGSLEVEKAKKATEYASDQKYRQHPSTFQFKKLTDSMDMVLAKQNAHTMNKHLYTVDWNKDKTKIHVMPDTPDILQAKQNQTMYSQKLYKLGWEEALKKGYDLPVDAISVQLAKASRDIASDFKYKQGYRKQLGHHVGFRSVQDDPKLVLSMNVAKMQSEREYKKDFEKWKTKYTSPVDMLGVVLAKKCQALVSDADYRNYLHQWTCLPDQNDVIQAKKAYELQSENMYKSDLEWLRGIGWSPLGSLEAEKNKRASEIISEKKYRQPPDRNKFTSIPDAMDIVLAKTNAKNRSDRLYREAWDKDKTQIHIMPDTPDIVLAKANLINTSDKIYRLGYEELKKKGYDLPVDAIPIKAAKASREIAIYMSEFYFLELSKLHRVPQVSEAHKDPLLQWTPPDFICHLAFQNLYKADLQWLKGIGWIPTGSLEDEKNKRATQILSDHIYRQHPDKFKFSSLMDSIPMVLAKNNAITMNHNLYTEAWNKDKTTVHIMPDTPEVMLAKQNKINYSEKLYKLGLEEAKRKGYDMRLDAIPIKAAKASRDIASDFKYKEGYRKQLGHHIGARAIHDDPKMMWSMHVAKIQSDREYKKDFEKWKTKFSSPVDMLGVVLAKKCQTLVSDADYRHYLHQWICLPDQNDVIHARQAYDLQSDNIYKSDLQWMRGIGWVPIGSLDVEKCKRATEILSDKIYRQPPDKFKFTSVTDSLEQVLAKNNAITMNKRLYTEAWDKDKTQIHIMPDTPEIMLARMNKINYSESLYKLANEEAKKKGYDLRADAIPIVAAKASRDIASDYKYKDGYRKQLGHHIGARNIEDDPKMVWSMHVAKIQSDREYKKDFEKWKTKFSSPVDMLGVVLAKKCQTLVSDVDYKHYLHQWTCLPDQNDVIHARQAYDLQSDNVYKSDLQWLRGIGWVPIGSLDVVKCKRAAEILSDNVYRQPPDKFKFTSVPDSLEQVLAKSNALNMNKRLYTEAWDKDKTQVHIILYKLANEEAKKKGYDLRADAIPIVAAKASRDIASDYKYKDGYRKQLGHHIGARNIEDDPKMVWSMHVRLYTEAWDKDKTQIHIMPDTPEIMLARQNKINYSESLYRQAMEEAKKEGYDLRSDAISIVAAKASRDIASDYKYKEAYRKQLGHHIGARAIHDDPKMMWSLHIAKVQSDREYKKDFEKYKTRYSSPVDMLGIVLAKKCQTLVSDVDYKHLLHEWTCLPDQNDVIQARKAYDLQSDNLYKADLEWMKGIGWVPIGSLEVVKAKRATEILSDNIYRQRPDTLKFTSVTDSLEQVLAKNNAITMNKRLYTEAWDNDKKTIHVMPDTPEIMLAKLNRINYSDKLYKLALEESKKEGYDLRVDAIPIQAAKASRDIASDYKYKEGYRKQLGHHIGARNIEDDPKMVWSMHVAKIQSDREYKKDFEKWKTKFSSPVDMLGVVLAKKCQILVSDIDYKHLLHEWTCLPDQNDVIQARKAYDLQSDAVYKADLEWLRGIGWVPIGSVEVEKVKRAGEILSDRKYRQPADQLKFTCIPDTPEIVLAKSNAITMSKHLYTEAWDADKASIHVMPDTPEILLAKSNSANISQKLYTKGWDESKMKDYDLKEDAISITSAKASRDIASDYKYKEAYVKQKGHHIGAQSIEDDPRIMCAMNAGKIYSDREYKKDFEKWKTKFSSPVDMLGVVLAKKCQTLVSDVDYRNYLHHWTCLPDQNDIIQAKKAYDLQSDAVYKADLEWLRGIGWMPEGSPEVLRVKNAQEILSDSVYRTPVVKLKYTSIVDTPEVVLAKTNAENISIPKYREVWDKDKTSIHIMPDTPEINLARANALNVSNKLYREGWDEMKMSCDVRLDAIPIQAAKASREIASDYKYKLDHEKQKGHYVGTLTARDDNRIRWALIADKLQNEREYRLQWAKWKAKIQSPADMLSILHSKKCQTLVSDIDYRNYLHEWTCMPDQNDVIQAKKAYELQSDAVYKADLEWLRGIGWMPNDSVSVNHAKHAADIFSEKKYRTKIETLNFTPVDDRVDYVTAKQSGEIRDDIKYRKDWNAIKSKYTLTETPLLHTAQEAARILDQYLYKEGWEKQKATGYILPPDAVPFVHAHHSSDVQSELKYKAEHVKQKGHYVGVPTMRDDPKLVWFEHAGQIQNDRLYKENYHKSKTRITIPADMVSVVAAKEGQNLVSNIDYRHYLRQWTCHPDQNDIIQARKAYDLQSDNVYKADLEWLRGIGWIPLDSVDHVRVTKNQEMVNQIKYKKEALDNYPNFTSVVDPPEIVLAKINSVNQSDVKYKETFNKAKGKYIFSPDTPHISHSKDMGKLYSTILYKGAWEGTKAYGYTLDERYIPIVGAKHADLVNSELKYKETYEKQKGHYLAGKEISEFPSVVHCLDFQQMRSALNYRRHYEDTKANVHIPNDMMNHVLAKRCQYILSDLEYRHYFHQWTSLPEEPKIICARNAQEILSDNVYKDDLNWLKGIGCYVWDTPQILHAKKAYDLQSQLQYTAASKDNLQNYNLVTDTPLYVTALQSGINASEVKYKENYHQIKDKYTTVLETVDYDRTKNLKSLYSSNLYKEAWDKVKATSYILPTSTLSLTHAKNQKHLASHIKYREEYEKFKALYTLPKSVEDDPNTARCLRVGKLNIDRLYRSVYEKNKMKIHIVPDMVEMVTAKDSQKKVSEIDYRLHLHEWICHPDLQVNSHVRKVTDQISDIVYKDDLTWLKGIGCYVWDTPEILHAKHAYDLRNDIKYKAHVQKTRNDYKLVTDTPVYVQAVKSGKQLSDAVYHYDYVHSVRGKVAPTTKTVDLDRALHAYKLQSENLYKTSLRFLPTGYRLPVDTPHFNHTKDTRYMSSYFKYKEAYEHIKANGYTLGPKDVPFVHVRRVNNVTSERLYRELYHKLKDKIHTTPDTPEIRQVKKTQEAVSELIYKSDFFKMQGHMISLPYTPQVLHCRYVGDITSDIKYKEDLQILKGLGCFLYDTPDMVRSRHLRKLWSNYIYTDHARKIRDKYKVVLDTPEYRKVQELKTHLSELVYRAAGKKQKSIFTSVPDTPDLLRAKRGQKLQSQYLYVELATKERPHHHAGNQTTALQHAKDVKDMVSEKKYKTQYEKMKDKYTPVPDTPILIRAKRAYWNASDLRYKETFQKTKGKYHTVKDALDIVYHRKVTDDISKVKYKENYMSQLGIWRSIPDRPEHFHHRAVTDAVSDVKYKEDLTWLRGIGCYAYDTPDFTLAEQNKKLYSKYKYKEVFERTKSNFKYVADCPINRHFKYATQLMNEKKYRADYEQRKDKYHLVVDEPRHLLAKTAGDQISQIKYRKKYEKSKDKFTSVVDTPEHLRMTRVNKQISDILYKLEYNKAKPRGYITIHDTPMLLHVRKVKDEVSDLKYKEVYQRNKSNCTIKPDAVHIKAAKDAYKVNTNLDYKRQYEANKAFWKWTPDRPDFIQAAKSSLQQSDFEYKLDREFLKGCKLSVTDDKDMVLALRNSLIESDLKYKEKHVKERGTCHAVPDTPQILLAKTVSGLVSENRYKAHVKKHLAQGSYTTLPETRDTVHVKAVTKHVSDTNYKKKFVKEKGRSNYSIMQEPPEVKHAMDVAKKQSDVAYKKDAKENLHYTTVADRPDIKKATQAAKQASEVEYRAKHRKEASHGLSMLGRPDIEMAKKAARLSSQVKYRENFDKEKGKTPKYNPKESQLYKTMKDANNLASEVKYKADLKKLHKPVTDMKESLIMHHVLNTSQLASSYQYKKNYEKSKGHYHTIPDNLEQLHLKEATELQSIVKYKEKYEKERGKPMLDFETPTYITAKESQQMQSGKEYRKEYEESIKGRNLTGLEVTPALLHVKYATKIASEKEYRKDLEESIRGKGLTEMEDTPDMLRAKNATQILNEKEYKRDLELEVKGRGLNAMANETPDFMRARNATDIASQVSASSWKGSTGLCPCEIQPSLFLGIFSQKKYKEDAEKSMSYYETVLDTPEMQRVRENQKNFSLLQYQCDLKNSKGKITVVQDTPEILRVKENQKNFSSVLYKEDVSPGTAIGKTPEMMRVKQTQDHISSVKYKEAIGQGTPIPDLPEVKRVKETQKHISTVLYKENLGKGIPTAVTPEMERVKRNQENVSSILYKENLSKGTPLPVTPEMERVKRNQENFSSVLYKENLGTGTPVPITPEMERVKHNQENFSSVLYKENMGKGTPLPVTPEMERVKHNQENISSVLYKENVGKATPTPVTPEMQRVKRNQENISSVLYRESLGKATPTPITPEMERVKRNQENFSSVFDRKNKPLGRWNTQDFSDINYRGIQRKVVEMEQKRNDQGHETITGLRVWRTNPGSVFDYDPAEDNIQSRSLHMVNVQAQRRSREQSRSASALSISGGEEKSEHSEAADHRLSTYSEGGVFFSASSAAYKHVKTTELPQQRSSSVATQQTTLSSIPSHPSTAGKIFRAMYDYMAADADEVSFKDGDAIVNVQAIDEGWMYGTVQRTGRTGMLPANYVEAI